MALVSYSDSEGSEDEEPLPQPKVANSAIKPAANSTSNFTVNRANPRKIQVKLQDISANGDPDDEPAAKRPRLGNSAGAFSGFNAMLPPPKRDADVKTQAKPAARKVFGLKTGAEPGFSRESDAELRHLFQEQQNGDGGVDLDEALPTIPKRTSVTPSATTEKPIQGNPFMFKPLSVARNNKKPKRNVDPTKSASNAAPTNPSLPDTEHTIPERPQATEPLPPPKKVSLFSMNADAEVVAQPQADDEEEDEIIEVLDESYAEDPSPIPLGLSAPFESQPQSLNSIASDLNLSKADRRQLFGRRGQNGGTAINVVNFNTDQEYAANEELRASGEQIQHNPVRSIAPGKHSLKQLVSAATGQKDALEESFATGRRNKKEAGSKYGW